MARLQPGIDGRRAFEGHQQHARRSHLGRHPCPKHKAGAHVAHWAIAGHIHNFIAIEHAQVRGFVGAGGQALQKRLHDAWQPRGLQI